MYFMTTSELRILALITLFFLKSMMICSLRAKYDRQCQRRVVVVVVQLLEGGFSWVITREPARLCKQPGRSPLI